MTKGSEIVVWSQEGDQWSQMISNASRSAVGEEGVAELERERRIGEPMGEDKVEDGAGVVLGEGGEASWGAAGEAWMSGGGVGAGMRSRRRERQAAGGG